MSPYSSKDYTAAVYVALVMAAIFALWSFYAVGYEQGYTLGYENGLSGFPDARNIEGVPFRLPPHRYSIFTFSESLRGYMATSLVISAIALWSRRPIGFLISLMFLLLTGLGYVWWYLATTEILRYAEFHNPPYTIATSVTPQIWGFYRATWWDITALVITIILFLWQLKTLPKVLTSSRSKQI